MCETDNVFPITYRVQAWEKTNQTGLLAMQKTETSLKIVSMSSQNHMDHEQARKPVFKKAQPIIGAQPGRG